MSVEIKQKYYITDHFSDKKNILKSAAFACRKETSVTDEVSRRTVTDCPKCSVKRPYKTAQVVPENT